MMARPKQRIVVASTELSKLVIQKKKVEEVRKWINENLTKPKILIVNGPNGCGKTTLIKSIGKEDRIQVKEMDSKINDKKGKSKEEMREWVLYSSEMRGLFGGDWRRSCILFEEECPSEWYVGLFVDYVRNGKMPLIITCNESIKNSINKYIETNKGNYEYEKLKESISYVTLNPITMNCIKKCLNGMSQGIINSIAEGCHGDLRIALNNKEIIEINSKFVQVISTNEAISFFHLIGRIIHTEPVYNEYEKRYELKHSPSSVAKELQGRERIIPLIEHNIISTIKEMKYLTYVEHYICLADIFQKQAFNQPLCEYLTCAVITGSVMVIPRKEKRMVEIEASPVNQSFSTMNKKGNKEIEECKECFNKIINNCITKQNQTIPFNIEYDAFCSDVLPFIEILNSNGMIQSHQLEYCLKQIHSHSNVFQFVIST
ncbi:hypothetical protein ENU1_059290 [Entamoeba nuttalli P19]|uniref:Uncharacterized protein n=1 Tax=Entamoeba nuttalli (strain P19) TaxID=1076696 RepID=K2H4R5_ENTNP|nr:hypothetical protein ENU1_059290 [Entamoeba nuttalli P19]EKE41337.1 hypothetical protein ENU1_059290 [Entamoeba nuttalli P19]|eukprot:XP_008856327.1 hypothetical protein ENU1_059290 [Entamoeba nuttalli P19]